MRIASLLLVLFVVSLFADTADAKWRRRSSVSFSGGPQSVAAAKAQRCAARGVCTHWGGGYGGGRAEGVGFSTHSAQAALNNCCFTGQRRVAGSSVVRGSRGWYAVKIYW